MKLMKLFDIIIDFHYSGRVLLTLFISILFVAPGSGNIVLLLIGWWYPGNALIDTHYYLFHLVCW